jgi:lactoylglutathione lyase
MSTTTITDVTVIGVPVSDPDKALEFFTETLGFVKRLDLRMENFRWLTVAPPDGRTSIALIASQDPGKDTGVRFLVPDAGAEHTSMKEHGVDVGELLRWPDVPPMYSFKDRDGNVFEVVESAG